MVYLFFFTASLTVYLILIAIRLLVFRGIKHILKKRFDESLSFESGPDSFFSIRNLNGKNIFGNEKVDCGKASLHISIFDGFHQIRSVELSVIDLNLKLDKIANGNGTNQYFKNSLEDWIKMRILIFFLTLFIRNAQLWLRNIRISYKDVQFAIQSCTLDFIRTRDRISGSLTIHEISVQYRKNPVIRIPTFSFELYSTNTVPRLILGNKFDELSTNIENMNLFYKQGQFQLKKIIVPICAKRQKEETCTIKINDIDILMPIPDLHTEEAAAIIQNISLENGIISTGNISITRNSLHLLSLSSLSYKNKHLKIPNNISISIATPLIIDAGLLIRFFRGSAEFEGKSKMSSQFNQFLAEAKSADFRLLLSDRHVILFNLKSISFQNMTVNARSVYGYFEFEESNYRFAKGKKASLFFQKPFLSIKSQSLNVSLNNSFAQASLLQEIFGMFSWIEHQFRGIAATPENKEKESPTRRVINFEVKQGKFAILNPKLTALIHHSNEAKRSAMETLLQCQLKSIQILEAKKAKIFNEKNFDDTSRKMLFDFYRESLKNMPPLERSMFKVNGENLIFTINGPAVKNKQQALSTLAEIDSTAKNTEFGRVTGGPFDINGSWVSISLPYIKNVIEIKNIVGQGNVFFTKNKGLHKNDYYHLQITCDNGSEVFNIPQLSCRSVTFANINANCEYGKLLMTPVELETLQDTRLNMILYRKINFLFKRLNFIDNCRLRFRVKANIDFKILSAQYNDVSRAYESNPFCECCFNGTKFIFDGKDYHVNSETMTVNLLSSYGYMKRVAIFYDPSIFVSLPSSNPLNPKGNIPIFIPIDSSKIRDKNYDPFEKYRTSSFYTYVKVTFNNHKNNHYSNQQNNNNLNNIGGIQSSSKNLKYGSITLDDRDVQSLLDEFLTPRFIEDVYRRPIHFVKRFTPLMLYAFTEVNVEFPPLSITLLDNTLNVKVYGAPIYFSVHNKNQIPTITVASENLNIVATYLAREIAFLQIHTLFVSKIGEENNVHVKSISGDISTDFLSMITTKKINITMPKKKNKAPTIIENKVFNTFDDFKKIFKFISMTATLDSFKIKLHLSNTLLITADINNFSYLISKVQNPKNSSQQQSQILNQSASLNTISASNINIKYGESNKLIDLLNFETNFAIASNLVVLYVKAKELDLTFRPADIEVFQGFYNDQISLFSNEKNDQTIDNIDDINHNNGKFALTLSVILFIGCSIDLINFKLIYKDKELITITLDDSELSYKSSPSGAENINAFSHYLTIVHNKGKDIFKKMFETSPTNENPIIKFEMNKTRKLMKCPVFEKIEFLIEPFTLRVPIPLIKKLLKIFPTAESLKMFTLEDEDLDIENNNGENNIENIEAFSEEEITRNLKETLEIGENDFKNRNENSIFIQEFIISPFIAELNIRRKSKGAFREFLERPFNYKGLHFYDVVGTQEKLTFLVKKNLKWTAIKALPSLMFRKRKREDNSGHGEIKERKQKKQTLPIKLEQKE
ncbi:hypothetical protein TRFO_33877 [Tritrichomonas foetus]|uniref:Uncharacterized protein n=1 Tax=Tritrichomonas foetus TaxID=1144522 RepID=A0A1J4JKF1_9EUKA|nr:hypothetical protein TRFO_33877 [Tritrichomonas foetus]|eukprot:OHS99616.1 hypothetical protein TRFO_33877 [Tritrichomonas foetus]